MFLIIVYAHSKWLDVCPMKTATTAATIERLRWSFATHGLPDTIVSDNGTVFTSGEFSNFLQSRGIRHVRSAPYHTATNKLAERAMQSVKQGLAKITQRTISERVTTFLLQYYRKTPHSTTGISPAEALMGRRLKLRIDLLSPSLGATVQQKQAQQKWNHDQRVLQVSFNMGDWVFVKNYRHGPGWLPGTVVRQKGPVSYDVQVAGEVWHRHMDQLRNHYGTTTTTAFPHNETPVTHNQTAASSEEVIETQEHPGPTDTQVTKPQSYSTTMVEPEPVEVTGPGIPFQTQETTRSHSDLTTGAKESCYPVRRRKPPDRLDL